MGFIKLCVSLTDDPSWSTHMPVHALVTRLPQSPDPAAALACNRVTWSGQCPPQGTLTLLTVASWHPWVAMVTSGTPGQWDKWETKSVTTIVACYYRLNHLNNTAKNSYNFYTNLFTVHEAHCLHHLVTTRLKNKHHTHTCISVTGWFHLIKYVTIIKLLPCTVLSIQKMFFKCLTCHNICPHIPRDRQYSGSHPIPPPHK